MIWESLVPAAAHGGIRGGFPRETAIMIAELTGNHLRTILSDSPAAANGSLSWLYSITGIYHPLILAHCIRGLVDWLTTGPKASTNNSTNAQIKE